MILGGITIYNYYTDTQLNLLGLSEEGRFNQALGFSRSYLERRTFQYTLIHAEIAMEAAKKKDKLRAMERAAEEWERDHAQAPTPTQPPMPTPEAPSEPQPN